MTVMLSSNLVSRKFSIIEHFFRRHYSQPRIIVKMHEALIDHSVEDNQFTCTLHYKNESLKVDRTFNFVRSSNETINNFLKRVDTSIRMVAFKKVKKQKNPDTSIDNIVTKDNVKDERLMIIKGKEELDSTVLCSEFLTSTEPVKLFIFGEEYNMKYNVPKITLIKLSDNIMATFPTYPIKLESKNMCWDKSSFTWFKSNITHKREVWEQVGEGFVHTPEMKDVGMKLKLLCTPRNDVDAGASVEIMSNDPIEAGPQYLPFLRRQIYTHKKTQNNEFRVVTYNILADMYSDTTYSKNVLFPYCPEYALNMNYRKNLILKELMGYNADVICLQEVDKKVFARDLNTVLPLSNYTGIYNNKPNVQEGLAVFVDQTKFDVLSSECSLMSENTGSLPDFEKVWSQLQNEKTKSVFLQRSNIVQAVALRSKKNPSRITLIGNTHLYFHPLADNIRLLQAFYAVTFLRLKAEQIRKENPEATVGLVFCGDFNSSPQDGIFKLFTTSYLPPDSEDWKTSQEDIVENIILRQNINFGSACGTPQYTNFTSNFRGCLDYIFYDQDILNVSQFAAMPTTQELEENVAIPSRVFPSDHISLCADLKWLD